MSQPESAATAADTVSLLDLAVAVAEAWKVLVAVPLVVGVAAFFIAQAQPRGYTVSVTIGMPAIEARALQTGAVIGRALDAAGVSDFDAEEVGAGLVFAAAQQATVVTLTLPDRGAARSILGALVAAFEETAVPAYLERQALPHQARVAAYDRTIERLENAASVFEDRLADDTDPLTPDPATFVAGYEALLSRIAAQQAAREEAMRLRDVAAGSVTISTLSSPVAVGRSPLLVAVTAAIVAGFATLVLVFVVDGLRRSARDPGGAEKIARIRRAFRLAPKVRGGEEAG